MVNMHPQLQELKKLLHEIDDLGSAGSLLSWDQTTYMPPGGAAARGRQLATLTKLAHEKFTAPVIGKLLAAARAENEDEDALLRVTRRDYERAIKIPVAFAAQLSEHQSQTYELWTKARPANDFASVRPALEKTLDLSRQLADFFPGYNHIADPLIDAADYGMKAATIRQVFGELRAQLVPIVKAITAQPVADESCLRQHFPEAAQLAFGQLVIRQFGFDFQRGRQDKTHHPFMTKFSLGDVRITTRVKENDLGEALFSTLHEAGHALYEQGIDPGYEGTPLAGGTSAGVHESQSRTWENLVGRSRAFWEFFYPQLQATFPTQLKPVPLATFYRAINKVERSLIRTDADEVTYNLHVMLRFDFELQLLEGKLAVKDLPDAWHARYESDLGLRAPDDRDGVLQDVHWYGGIIGGVFQGYTLGNILSAQFFEAAPHDIAGGNFKALHDWLRENIYRHGRKFTADELLQRATGQPMTIEPYVRYLRKKYGELYRL
ncbi:MAG: Thermostable carboxypeptidase 1 [Verrucomicrobiae bacterium]|nr:Thermostable carboxypeptidase 1 [Verrucomicrobiae bacterium]